MNREIAQLPRQFRHLHIDSAKGWTKWYVRRTSNDILKLEKSNLVGSNPETADGGHS
jgi:hypothetical protein